MTTLDRTSTDPLAPGPRAPQLSVSTATRLGMVGLVLAPVAFGTASLVQDLAIGQGDPATDPAAFLSAVAGHPGLWTTFALLMLAGAGLTMAWVPAVWRVTTGRSPRWSWAAAVVGTLFALGQMVHLMSWVVLSPAMAEALDPDSALALVTAVERDWFFYLIFAPYLIGVALAAPAATVALRRGQLLPIWAVALVTVVSVAAVILGNVTMPMMLIHPLALVVGLAPAVVRVLRAPSA